MPVLESVRDYAQSHPVSVAAGFLVLLPGTYIYITGSSVPCTIGLCDAPSLSSSQLASILRGLPAYESQYPFKQLSIPFSNWIHKPAPAFAFRKIHDSGKDLVLLFTAGTEKLGINVQRLHELLNQRWAWEFPFSRFTSVAIVTALPGAFLLSIRNKPQALAARHQTKIANALRLFAFVTVANGPISLQDLLVTVFVMASFEVFQRTVKHDSRMVSSSSVQTFNNAEDNETTEAAEILELKRTQNELESTKNTLDATYKECASLRDGMKSMKQTLGREHHAAVYRKDIELFALRKANEQKENYINEHDTKLEDIYRSQKAALELKDAQLRNLQDRVKFLGRKDSPKLGGGEFNFNFAKEEDPHSAVEVKFLRVQGRSSTEIERAIDEKNTEVEKLKIDLAKATNAIAGFNKMQEELRRAWDATFEVRTALNEERESHAETQDKLRKAALRIEEELKKGSPKISFTALPTIDEQGKHELEAMFNAAQADNLRLYTEVEALEKRVREANSRVFSTAEEAAALREQLRVEKAINADMETARPSLVHRVHFQRMEGQLKELNDVLEAKEAEIARHTNIAAEKDAQIARLVNEKTEATQAHSKTEEENARLQTHIADLETTKDRLMLDHERLARLRGSAKQRTMFTEQAAAQTQIQTQPQPHTSARSSGTTLITPPNDLTPVPSDEPPHPAARRISLTPTLPTSPKAATSNRLVRNDTARFSVLSNDTDANATPPLPLPLPEVRASRRKSITLKGLMKRFGGGGKEIEGKSGDRPKTALREKDGYNKVSRPKTAVPVPALPVNAAAGKDLAAAGLPVEQLNERSSTNEAASAKVEGGKDGGKNMMARPSTAAPAGNTDRETTGQKEGRRMTMTTFPSYSGIEVGDVGGSSGAAARPQTAITGLGAARPQTAIISPASASTAGDGGKEKERDEKLRTRWSISGAT
jgi:hypothetical protein